MQVLEKADCGLLLDVNNIHVNSINHGYDAEQFLAALPGHRVVYGHIAGHYNEAEDLRVDTHGADVIEPVWGLLECAYQQFGVFPTLLERDFNIPPVDELMLELTASKPCRQRSRHMPKSRPSFQQTQGAFAAHIRHPQLHQAPEHIEDRRLEIYRNLFFNNIESFLASGFPILKSLMVGNKGGEENWTNMVRDFIHRHQSHSPYFLQISEEFLAYLQQEYQPQAQ